MFDIFKSFNFLYYILRTKKSSKVIQISYFLQREWLNDLMTNKKLFCAESSYKLMIFFDNAYEFLIFMYPNRYFNELLNTNNSWLSLVV